MKKLVLILLLLSTSVCAATFLNSEFVGQISRDQFASVTCEREKKLGASSSFEDRVCCINANKNQYCENDEPVLGTCLANVCLWPTDTYKPWYSWRYKSFRCPGFAILAGHEFDDIMKWAGCDRIDYYWCCSPYAFPTFEGKAAVASAPAPKTPTGGALLVLDASKWRSLELGAFKQLKPEQRALSAEKKRCSNGGKAVKILDKKYGSFFADSRNLKPGMRVFYITQNDVIPLVSWC